MIFTVFSHPCGQLQVKLGGLFFLPVVTPEVPAKCEGCESLRPMPDAGYCCRADSVGQVSITTGDIRQFALARWQREQEIEGLAATAKAEREGIE